MVNKQVNISHLIDERLWSLHLADDGAGLGVLDPADDAQPRAQLLDVLGEAAPWNHREVFNFQLYFTVVAKYVAPRRFRQSWHTYSARLARATRQLMSIG